MDISSLIVLGLMILCVLLSQILTFHAIRIMSRECMNISNSILSLAIKIGTTNEQTEREEVEEWAEIIPSGVYRPSVEDYIEYYKDRADEDREALYNPYDDEVLDLLNG